MCFEFITHFVCDMSVQVISREPKRDELIRHLVGIAQLIQAVALHQNTSKAIRDRRCQIMEALQPLSIQVKTEQSTQFFDILSSVIELNEGSCSRCNKPIDWRTALFCEGCRRVAYCGVKCQKKDWRYGSHCWNCSFLACSAHVLGLTTCDVRRSRNIVELTGLRNNIITSQKKLFLQHEVALFSQLLTYPDRSDYIVVFDLSTKQQPFIFVHYSVQCTCSTQRKWFEDFRSLEKVVCLFMSDVLNGEIDDEGNVNRIGVYAAFSIPNHIQSLEAARNSSAPSHTRAEALKDMGNDYFKIGDYKSAVEMYKSATTINSSAPIYWSNLAASYEKLGMYDEMQKASEHCIDTDQTFIKGYFRLAAALKAKLQMSESIVTLDRGLDIDPTNADLKKMKKEVWKILHSTIGCRIFQSKEGRWHKDDSFQFGTKE
jgi:tetratricopeptide (TPR) repeat protein